MIIEIVNEVDNIVESYYIIPFEVGKVLKRAFGSVIHNPTSLMGEKLYSCYMSFCLHMEDIQVKQADIIFYIR